MNDSKKHFQNWAKSFSGCDGGDLTAGGIWYCGIEWGGSWPSPEKFKSEIEAIPETFPKPFVFKNDEDLRFKALGDPFNRRLAKLHCGIQGHPIKGYNEYFLRHRPLTAGSGVAKLNLFPAACRKVSEWPEHYAELTGFASKFDYQSWCRQERFPALARLVAKHKPKAIIGCGTGFTEDFKLAFGGNQQALTEHSPAFVFDSGKRKYKSRHYLLSGGTQLFVTPFFGRPLNSDLNTAELAAWIRGCLAAQEAKKQAA